MSTQIEHLENHRARLIVEVAPERVDKAMHEAARRIVPQMSPATEEDWYTEYLAAILSVRVVSGLDEAIEQFKISAQDPEYALGSLFASGECYRARGRIDGRLADLTVPSEEIDRLYTPADVDGLGPVGAGLAADARGPVVDHRSRRAGTSSAPQDVQGQPVEPDRCVPARE